MFDELGWRGGNRRERGLGVGDIYIWPVQGRAHPEGAPVLTSLTRKRSALKIWGHGELPPARSDAEFADFEAYLTFT